MKGKIQKSNVQEIFELSSIQKGMLYHFIKDGAGNLYSVQLSFAIDGDLDVVVLRQALELVQVNNEALRSVFSWEKVSKPLQIIVRECPLDFRFSDLSQHSNGEVLKLVQARDDEDWHKKFDLTEPPFRIHVIRVTARSYIFNVTYHHLLYDGWSNGILLQEIFHCYDQLKLNRKPVPASKPTYKTIHLALRQRRDNTIEARYWKDYLKEHKSTILFLKNHSVQEGKGEMYRELFTTPSRKLQTFVREHKVTQAAVIYAAYGLMLHRYLNSGDVVFGTTVSDRDTSIPGIDKVIGTFINTIPLRLTGFEDKSFLEVVTDVSRNVIDRNRFSGTAYQDIRQMLELKSNDNLYDSIIAIENYPVGADAVWRSSEFDIRLRTVRENTSTPLVINVFFKEALEIELMYKMSFMTSACAESLAGNFIAIINEILDHPRESVRSLSLSMSDAEQKSLLAFNNTGSGYTGSETVVHLFERQAVASPDNTALVLTGNVITYRALKERSDRFASFLRMEKKVGKGALIGVMMEREEWLIAAMLGVLKAGGAYVPIDPAYPAARVTSIIEDSGLKLLITRGTYRDGAAATQVLDLDECCHDIDAYPVALSPADVNNDDLAYVLYTSGSTGTPKGVMVEHRSLVNYVTWAAEKYVRKRAAAFPLYTSISFDLTVTSIYVPLITGNRILVYGEDGKNSVIGNIFSNREANIIKLTPSHLKIVRDAGTIGLPEDGEVRTLIVGGEDLPAQLALDIHHKFRGQVEIYNEYGPTEATVGCMIHKFDPEETLSSVSIGIPINNSRIYVLDELLHPVPAGAEGELYISGCGVARGYLNNGALTNERFMADPFHPGDRMYKTGDVAIRCLNGSLLFRGRIDDQVKIKGFRIELGEIQVQLASHELVKEAVVIARKVADDEYLVAYFMADTKISATALKDHLSARLPEYMIPGHYIQLETIPLTTNGKLDKKALPDLHTETSVDYVAPTDEIETRLVEIWSELLKLEKEKISVTRSFLELGGHSLKIILMLNRVLKAFSVPIPINEFFSYENVRNLGARIRKEKGTGYSPLRKVPASDHYKLSSAQKRLYFLYEFDRSSTAYNGGLTLSLEGDVDVTRIADTFQKLVDRYEIMRTSFALVDGVPVQKIAKHAELTIAHYEVDENEVPALLVKIVQPFDLEKAPLMRVALIRTGSKKYVLNVDMHHIAGDGVSQEILIRDFTAIYNGKALPEVKVQYKDYATWQQGEEQQKALATQRAFWMQEFATLPEPAELPLDLARPLVRDHTGMHIDFEMSAADIDGLRASADREKATMFMVMLAVYNIFLSKLCNGRDIVVGTPVAGRNHADVETMIGMFVNTLSLRNSPEGGLTFVQFLSAVKAKTLACFSNQSYPYEELVDVLKVERSTGHNPLFDVMFVYENFKESELVIPGVIARPLKPRYTISKFDLALLVYEKDGHISFAFEYSTALFKKETVEKFAAYFREVASAVAMDPQVMISAIDIVPAAEKQVLLNKFNPASVEYPAGHNLVTLFEKQVTARPNKVAVIHGETRISYKQLNNKANAIASLISKRLNGMTNRVVALLFHPSPEMLASILGVMKSGNVFVPLAPDMPAGRNSFIVSDCQASLLLVQAALYEEQYRSGPLAAAIDVIPVNGKEPQQDANPSATILLSDPVYIIYTSGTTGNPKGVKISHKGLLNYALWSKSYHELTAADVAIQLVPYHFDGFGANFYPVLISGAALVTIPEAQRLDAAHIVTVMRKERVTNFAMLPGLFDQLLNELTPGNGLTHLRFVVLAGEQASEAVIQKSENLLPHTLLENEYGPTEATIAATHSRMLTAGNTSVIGKPVSNAMVYILGVNNEILPVGIKGEICVSGDGIAKGYVNNDALTREKFIEDPFVPGKRMYRTGDIGSWMPDGNIQIFGRSDDQIKIRGHRVEPGEIVAQVMAFDGIKDAVVLLREKNNDKHLVVYYVSRREIEVEKIRTFLTGKLPGHMVPSFYVHLQNLPYTAIGKIDRKALLDIEIFAAEDYQAPETKAEQLLTMVWSKVLGVENIGTTDNFFVSGGDSIKSIQVSARMRMEGYDVSVRDIFSNQTIRELAPKLKSVVNESDQSLVTGNVPLTPVQKWFFSSPVRNKHHFNQSVTLSFPQGITEGAVIAIFGKMLEHHDALRMVFRKSDGQVIQENADNRFSVPLEVIDLKATKDPVLEIVSIGNRLQSGIRLEHGPLLKLALVQVSKGSHLLIVIHHLVIDGVSWRILFDDIESLYQQVVANESLHLPPKTDSYMKWSMLLPEYTMSKKFGEGVAYWRAISEKTYTPLPIDYRESGNGSSIAGYEAFSLSKELTSALLNTAHASFNTQVNDILLSGLLLSVKKCLGQHAVWIDMEGHGREVINPALNVSRTVGWFTAIYPVLLQSESDTLPGLIKQVKEALRKIPNSGIDYLLYKYGTEGTASVVKDAGCQAQISFNYLGQFDPTVKGKPYQVSAELAGNNVSPGETRLYDWEITGMVSGGQLKVQLTYSNPHGRNTVKSFLNCYEESLNELITYCSTNQLPELTPSDLTFKDLTIEQVDALQRCYALEDIYPLSPMQESLLYHSMLDPDSESYFEQMAIKVSGDIDVWAVQKTMNDLIGRYDILRTVFLQKGYDRPLQMVLKESAVNFSYKDIQEECRHQPVDDVVAHYCRKDRSKKFDLSGDVLIRLSVLKTGADAFCFIWSHHHIVMDGWCMGIMLQDFKTLYAANKKKSKKSLPPVRRYADYIIWLQNREKEESLRYWEKYLSSYDTLATMPKRESAVAGNSPYDPALLRLVIDKAQTKMLHKISRQYGVTLSTILQCMWAVLLMKYNNVTDVVFGSVVSGRPPELAGIETMVGLFINTLPVRVTCNATQTFSQILQEMQQRLLEREQHGYLPLTEIQSVSGPGRGLLDNIIVFENYPIENVLLRKTDTGTMEDFAITEIRAFEQINYNLWVAIVPGEEISIKFNYNVNLYARDTIERVSACFGQIISQLASDAGMKVSDIDIISPSEKQLLLNDFNNTTGTYDVHESLMSLFEKQALRTPDKTAVVYEGRTLTYRELDARAGKVASYLVKNFNIRRGDPVAIMMSRSDEMMTGLLGILKSGGAYVPIDPVYPKERIAYILEDSGARVMLVNEPLPENFEYAHHVVQISDAECGPSDSFAGIGGPDDLCYLIYTSGSTGKPKGVMVSHRNVVNFFAGMSRALPVDDDDCMLAVTSTSFDISVLELFWTLCQGMEVVIHPTHISLAGLDRYLAGEDLSMDFSLFFFSSYNHKEEAKYKLLLEAAKYADENGFQAIWTPERHFHEFGGLYPNPSVVTSALTMITRQIALRSGSVVSPLHDSIRIAEEWSVVDNLSRGRVALSFASGWNPNDFVLAPKTYENRHEKMYAQIEEIKRLWKGESIHRKNGFDQEVDLRVFPSPLQKELPIWITAAKSDETFARAGAMGAHVLTHFLGQDIEELERKIKLYREVRAQNGYESETGKVAVMFHTYIGNDIDEVEKLVEKPFMEYLKSSIGLGKVMLEVAGVKADALSKEDENAILKNAFRRYYKTSALIGTKSSCSVMVSKLRKIGVDEIACLVDFGLPKEKVLEGLRSLNGLRALFSRDKKVRPHKPVTVMQSTPSLVKMLVEDPGSRKFLESLKLLLIGGEAVPLPLIQGLKRAYKADLFNMYGPTETTIWSCLHRFDDSVDKVTIGKPILNTEVYILDKALHLVPIGLPGDLYIGGDGLSKGYWNKPSLTRERFMPNPFRSGGDLYKTGDIARWLPDGNIELLGREDSQVKINGYRIELGEIENTLTSYAGIREAAVLMKEKNGTHYLIGYLVAEDVLDFAEVKKYLRRFLPEYMIPGYFVQLSQLPLTPNGKMDRKALPDPELNTGTYKAPSTSIEKKLAEIWSRILKMDEKTISVDRSFFEMGGHSLNATALVNQIYKEFNVEFMLQKIFVTNTIEQIADYIENQKWVLKEEVRHGMLQDDEVILD